jgi:hypothetical protein
MKIKTQIRSFDNLIYTLLLIPSMLTGDLINPAISLAFGALLLFLLIIRTQRINLNEVIIIIPLIMIIILGLLGSVFQHRFNSASNIYLVGKDVWYFIKPVVYISIGFYIYRVRFKKEIFLTIILYVSLLISIHHIIRVFIYIVTATPEMLSLDTIRSQTGPGNLLEGFSLAYTIILLRSSDLKRYMPSRWLLISIFTLSIILSFSRTIIISFIISLFALNNFFSFRLSILIKSIFIVTFTAILAILTLLYLNRTSHKDSLLHSLTGKYLNTMKELTYEKKNVTPEEINRNWRGIETHLAKEEIKKGSIIEKVFGFGFGKTVFLDNYQGILGEENINIPIFHNGFTQILIKTGYSGILLYCLFFIIAFWIADKDPSNRDTDQLLKAILVTSFFATLVITGLYNKNALDPTCIAMGYLIGSSLNRKLDTDKRISKR